RHAGPGPRAHGAESRQVAHAPWRHRAHVRRRRWCAADAQNSYTKGAGAAPAAAAPPHHQQEQEKKETASKKRPVASSDGNDTEEIDDKHASKVARKEKDVAKKTPTPQLAQDPEEELRRRPSAAVPDPCAARLRGGHLLTPLAGMGRSR